MESINRPSLSMSMASTLAETTTENKTKMDDYYRPKPKLTLSIASASTLTKAATAIEIENRNKVDDYYRPKPKLSLSVAATSTTKPTTIDIEKGIVDYPPKLSLPEKRKLATTLVYLVGFTGYHSVAALFRGKKGAKYYFIHVVHAIVRESIRSMTCREWQYLVSTTLHNYESFARAKRFQPQSVSLERYGGTGYWIGDKNAQNVIVYFHGGGFMVSASMLHFRFCWSLLSALDKEIQEPQRLQQRQQRQQRQPERPITPQTSIFFVDYTLTPHAAYPTQIRQCVEAIHYLVTETNRPFSSITLGGDAAGGNLALAVLSHMLHPHPEIDLLLPSRSTSPGPNLSVRFSGGSGRSRARDDQFAGLFCIGPWVSFAAYRGWTSLQENCLKDMVTNELSTTWSQKYLNGRREDRWNQPVLASPAWWRGCPVRRALILAGSEEIFLSSIEEFARRFMAAVPNSVFFVGPDEGHITPITDRTAKYTNNRQGKELMKWLAGIYEPLEKLQ